MKTTALITGASSGIGLELAKEFAKNNHNLVLVARSGEKLKNLKESLESDFGVEVLIIPKDLALPAAAQEIYNILNDKSIVINYLVNNAGFGDFGFFHETSWEKEASMIDLNVRSLTEMTKLFARDMVGRGEGRIMNLASTASFQPGPLMAVYYATKHYVLAFSEAIANEFKDFNVTVTALCPGPTKSGFQSASDIEDSRLVKGKKLPTSKDVAVYGYKAMMKGKRVAIHGTMNRLLAESVRFMPRKMVTKTVRKLQEKK